MSNQEFVSIPDSAQTFFLSPTSKAAPEGEINKWRAAMQDPEHSERYAQRWDRIEAAGSDIHGEARAIDAMAQRGSTILDAGSGNGRLAGYLARVGHDAMGIDLDPYLVDVANTKYPEATFEVADLADFTLYDTHGALKTFDIVVSAGNVQAFLADWERIPTLINIAEHMHVSSRYVTGFQLGRGYSAKQFTTDAEAAGLEVSQRFGTWQFEPFEESSDFLLAILRLQTA